MAAQAVACDHDLPEDVIPDQVINVYRARGSRAFLLESLVKTREEYERSRKTQHRRNKGRLARAARKKNRKN